MSTKRNNSTPNSRAYVAAIISKPRVAVAMGKEFFYRQVELGIADAYDAASQIMACNMMDEAALESVAKPSSKNDRLAGTKARTGDGSARPPGALNSRTAPAIHHSV